MAKMNFSTLLLIAVFICGYQSCQNQPGKLPDDYYQRATYYYDRGQFNRAEAQLFRAIQLKPEYAEAHNLLGATNYALYERNFKRNPKISRQYYQRARLAFQEAMKHKKDYASPHIGLAILQILNENFDDAIASLLKAREVEPHNFETMVQTHYHMGRCYNYKKEYRKSLEEFREYLLLNPNGQEVPGVRKAVREIEDHLNLKKSSPR